MSGKSRVVLAAVLLFITACSYSATNSDGPTDQQIAAPVIVSVPLAPSPFTALERPSKLTAHTAPDSPFIFIPGRFLFGAHTLQQYHAQNVTGDEHRAVFAPNWTNGLDGLAYAIYRFDMTYFEGEGNFILEWEGDAPFNENLFIALGNFTTDGWDWILPDAEGPLVVDDLVPYMDEYPYLLLAVALIGHMPASLESITIGQRFIHESVDMSELCAPVLDFEVANQLADFASRNPVAQDYLVEAEEVDPDGFLTQVISHTVDGYTHYGVVRVPPHVPDEKLAIVLLCHESVWGTATNGAGWFDFFTGPELKEDLIVLLPSFRGESVAGDLGVFTSEGPPSYYNRDVDDALAMLDTVLVNYPEADADRVFAVGWSRGATVAQRASQRDPRIRAVVEFAGMTDEWNKEGQGYIHYFLGFVDNEPSTKDSYTHTLWQLKNDLTDVWTTRRMLLHNSSVYLAQLLPPIQIHCGDLDTGLNQSERLRDVLAVTPGAEYECYIYEGGTHTVGSLTGAGERMKAFLLDNME